MSDDGRYSYSSDIFNNVSNLNEAIQVILTQEDDGMDSANRWHSETPHLLYLMKQLNLFEGSVVLDYGCGIGRLAKGLIDAYGCKVIGVDISRNMRALSLVYVNSDNYTAIHPTMLDGLDLKFDAAICVWVLQHCYDPQKDLNLIKEHLKEKGKLFVVNNHNRAVPVKEDAQWINDGANIKQMLEKNLTCQTEGKLDPAIVSERLSELTYWGIYN